MFVALCGFDLYLHFDGVVGNTYSARIASWGIKYRTLPYLIAVAFGALLTHWFAKRNRHGAMSRRKKLITLALLTGAVVVGGLLGFHW
jgi:hypothetical protein